MSKKRDVVEEDVSNYVNIYCTRILLKDRTLCLKSMDCEY